MNRKLSGVVLVLAAGVAGLAMVASAAGTSSRGTKTIRPHGMVVALALDGNLVAFGNGPAVLVWNLRTGKTTNLHMGEDAHLDGLAIAGSSVASYWNATSNFESDDYLLTSSLLRPKGRMVESEARTDQAQCGAAGSGYTPACAGTWLGGVVGNGNRILVNRWTTDTTGAITQGGLYALNGSKLKPVATGPQTVEAVAADSARVAVLQWRWHPPGTTIHVFSSNGARLSSVTPKGYPLQVAISGGNLVVLERSGNLALYNAGTGLLRRTFNLHAKELPKNERPYGNPRWLQALAVHGTIAVYSKPLRYTNGGNPRESAIHAINLSTGTDQVIGRSPGQIPLAEIDKVGLVYSAQADGYAHNNLVFVPLAQLAAAVS